jgi:sn-glycerol 3-phosphate transport system permease protein
MRVDWRLLALLAASAGGLLWAVPFAWMMVAALRPGVPADIASLTPAGPFGPGNFQEAWHSGSFPLWYLNTFIVCGGILAVQLVTVSAAGYAFAPDFSRSGLALCVVFSAAAAGPAIADRA